MTDDEIAAIRARHAADQERRDRNGPYYMVADDMHADRAALLAEVERLRADAAALREAGKRLLDNIDTGSYESEQQAVAEFRAALAAKEVEHDW